MPADPRRVKDLFVAAIDLADASERTEMLDRECGGDAELRQQVVDLLAAHDAPHAALNQPLAAPPDLTGAYASQNAAPTESIGSVLAGKYKLLQEVGEGGMGSVFMADQLQPVKRRVAVKVIKAGMDSARVLARFEAERQALALMDHPNIAKVLDAGATESGRPFFVMELVKGIPLTQFCDQHKLPIFDRLNLFMQICSAVQHAHQKGIIHRDLKPTNILVESHDGKPVPKVIDFGLAKATSGIQLSEHTLFTALGQVAGTPLYMAPEQAAFNAVDVDTRADVYALGVILYELLTGTTPIERETFKKAAFDEMMRMIREQEPVTPSSRLSSSETKASVAAVRQMEPAKLGRYVRGELDWIVMKSLSKERDRRYETANGLAKDIERFLNREPVLAGPPSAGYKLKKFVQRNRSHVIAAIVVLSALVTGIVGTTLGMVRATKAEGVAQSRFVEAESARALAAEFRDKALDALRATTGEDVEKLISEKSELGANERAYLEAIVTRWQKFATQEGNDEQTLALRGEGHYRVAYLWYKLGQRREALDATEKALSIQWKLVEQFPNSGVHRQQLASTQNNMGMLLADLGKPDDARAAYQAAIDLQQELADRNPVMPDYKQALGRSYNNLGILLAGNGKSAEASSAHETAKDLLKSLVSKYAGVRAYQIDLGRTLNYLAIHRHEIGDRNGAKKAFEESRMLWQELADRHSSEPDLKNALANCCNNFGLFFHGLSEHDKAHDQFQKARDLQQLMVSKYPAVLSYQMDLARTHTNLGILLSDIRKLDEARDAFEKARDLQQKVVKKNSQVHSYKSDLARTLNLLAINHDRNGRVDESRSTLDQAGGLWQELVDDNPTMPAYKNSLANYFNNLGVLLYGLNTLNEARIALEKARALHEDVVNNHGSIPAYKVDLGNCYTNLGRVIRDQNQVGDSLRWFEIAIETLAPMHKAEPRDPKIRGFLRDAYAHRATANDRLHQFGNAANDWDTAITLSPDPEQPEVRAARAMSRVQSGQIAAAIAETAELAKSPNWNAIQWYDFACVYAVASGKIADKRQELADRAMELLQKAVKAGYKHAAHMVKDTNLDPIRGRGDFKKLIADLEKKSPPKAQLAPPPREVK